MALKFQPGDDDATVSVGVDPSQGSGLVPLDEDLNGVFKVTDKDTQVFVVETTKDGETLRQVFALSGLTLEPEPAPPMPIVATPDAVTVVGDSSTLQQLSTLTVDGVPWEPVDAPVLTVNGTTCQMETEPGIRVWYWPAVPDDLGPDDKLVQFAMQDAEPGVLSAIVDEGIEAVLTVVVADAAGAYEPATVTVTVTAPAPPRLIFEPQEMTKTLGDDSGRVTLMLDGEPYRGTTTLAYDPPGVFDLDSVAPATGKRDFSTHSVGSAIATATVSVDGQTLTATFTGTVTTTP